MATTGARNSNDPMARYWPTTKAYKALSLEVPPNTPAAVIEHHFKRDERSEWHRQVLGPRLEVVQHRYICSCGWTSSWSKWPLPTFRQMQAHALEGQRSFDWPL